LKFFPRLDNYLTYPLQTYVYVAPPDLFLVPNLKLKLKGRRLDMIVDSREKMTKELTIISEDEFYQVFVKFIRTIQSLGNYLEGNNKYTALCLAVPIILCFSLVTFLPRCAVTHFTDNQHVTFQLLATVATKPEAIL
jgi:hypothetical protein